MPDFLRIKDDVRQFGGQVWRCADAEIEYENGVLLEEPTTGQWLYFTDWEVEEVPENDCS